MSISRTAKLGVLCSTLAVTVICSAPSATAKPVWCEPGSPDGCARWHATTEEHESRLCWEPLAGLTTAQCLKLLDERTL